MIDEIDRQILDILRRNARTPVSDIARVVRMSPQPVARRIRRLETSGVIRGYTTMVDESVGGSIEAFTEVRLDGRTETSTLERLVAGIPEVHEVLTVAGDIDGLLHFRARDVEDLRRIVNSFRRSGMVSTTKTHIVLHTWAPERPASE